MVTAYTQENLNKNTFIRTFEKDVDTSELVWHTDEFDRTVKILNDCSGWLFQFDNKPFQYLRKGDVLEIPKDVYHRVFRFDQSSALVIEINEKQNNHGV